MKHSSFIILCFFVFSCTAPQKALDGIFTPNCKQFAIGSVCFQNTNSEMVKVELEDHKMEVLPFTTLCIDLYEGSYDYKVKGSGEKWKEDVRIVRCREKKIELREEVI